MIMPAAFGARSRNLRRWNAAKKILPKICPFSGAILGSILGIHSVFNRLADDSSISTSARLHPK
jgi:hypothetical protein